MLSLRRLNVSVENSRTVKRMCLQCKQKIGILEVCYRNLFIDVVFQPTERLIVSLRTFPNLNTSNMLQHGYQ